MKIGIDARFLTHPQAGGFKTYTQSLIAALAKQDQENQYVLYVDRQPNGEVDVIPYASNIVLRIVRGEWPVVGMALREQIGLAQAVLRDRIDVFHSPALTAPLFLSCPLVVTLHDTIWYMQVLRSQLNLKRQFIALYYRYVAEWAARRATVIITVSDAARSDIISQLGIPAERVAVTYEAAAPCFKPVATEMVDAVRAKYSLPTGFVMAIGSADPRKNVALLLEAYARLSNDMRNLHHLVIVWTHQHLAEKILCRIKSLGLTHQCHFVRQISNHDLACLYNAAALFVFPSRYEGFGLPPLEAMACGTAVAAANNSSIPEIVGDGALLFDSESDEEMAQAMAYLLANDRARAALAEHGARRAARFSWARCAQQTVTLYLKCGTASGNTESTLQS